ncbi:MAG: tRNA (adenosine(37)-N6)-dimethylallyltransferase MiaA [Deltaproteobacteria bacterium]|nr:tRNA (adenosine(37)-N6)-dimethylallyltransferase MiaA [Deltaproteobacteria bacterium]
MSKRQKVVVISGPTASGKTSLGVDLALALKGEIISADSMQVYRGMDVGTAKPTIGEQKGIPHHLLDVVDPDEEFNAAIYNSMAIPKITEIGSRERSCFIVGGTGLYIKGLLDGLFECPPVDTELRESLRRECDSSGSAVLHERLADLDPESADKIHPNDRVRIIRALEIIHLTKRRFSDLTGEHAFGGRNLNALKLCLKVDREELYKRIDKRSSAMVENGLVEETESLLRKGYSPDLKPMKAIGYRHMITYLKRDWSLDEAISELQKDTRRYAKRQLTWFRADPEVIWLEPGNFHMFKDKVKEFLIETA